MTDTTHEHQAATVQLANLVSPSTSVSMGMTMARAVFEPGQVNAAKCLWITDLPIDDQWLRLVSR